MLRRFAEIEISLAISTIFDLTLITEISNWTAESCGLY